EASAVQLVYLVGVFDVLSMTRAEGMSLLIITEMKMWKSHRRNACSNCFLAKRNKPRFLIAPAPTPISSWKRVPRSEPTVPRLRSCDVQRCPLPIVCARLPGHPLHLAPASSTRNHPGSEQWKVYRVSWALAI
ncbi:hypothetical protein EDC04DRAFT_2718535, partial [Pisolithus marmoratus]